jgi:hypothetical protein
MPKIFAVYVRKVNVSLGNNLDFSASLMPGRLFSEFEFSREFPAL